MIKPKLALVPSAYKGGSPKGTLYSVLPSDGVGDFDFTRASEATRINKDGLIETVSSNVPRLNYPLIDGVVSGCPSLLLEPSRSNLVTYSEDFTQGAWTKLTNSTAVGNVAISPDGTQNSSEIKAVATSTSLLGIQDAFTVSSGVDYTVSFFAKKGVARYIQLFNGGGQVTGNARTNFDLEDGVVTVSDAGHTSTIEDFGNGWFRCVVELNTLTTTLQTYFNAVKEPNASRSATSSWSANDNFYLWGAQVEQGSYATSYIPTQGSIGTRDEEDIALTLPDNASFNSSNGFSIYGEFLTNGGSGSSVMALQFNTNSGYFGFGHTGLYWRARITNGTQNELHNSSVSILSVGKLALSFNNSGFSMYANGSSFASGNIDMSAVTSVDSVEFRDTDEFGSFRIRELKLYNQALSDAELAALTKI